MANGVQGFGSDAIDPEMKRKWQSKGGKVKHPKKGFGSMSPKRRREVASKGGKA